MNTIEAGIIGLVEGITEYLPVSSTGHIILTQRIMGIGISAGDKEAADAFAICVQLGAILAVLGIFFTHVKAMLLGLIGKDPEGRKLLINIVVGFLPAMVLGLALNDIIKEYLFGLWPIVTAWFVGGLAILLVDRKWRAKEASGTGLPLSELSWKQALIIGFMQCIAMWPGTSRSLVTILGGQLVGMRLKDAVTYSFLLGTATLGASTVYDFLKSGDAMLELYGIPPLAVGFVCAFIAAAASVAWMLAYLNKHGLAVFGYYRIGLALVIAGCLTAGLIPAT
jgi:undecaprenyl-diphosphatase